MNNILELAVFVDFFNDALRPPDCEFAFLPVIGHFSCASAWD
jgi:hypothetical protein